MASSPYYYYYSVFLLVSLLSLLHHHKPVLSSDDLHTRSRLFRPKSTLNSLISTRKDTTPSTPFEVTKPIKLPSTQPCSYLLLQHDFGFTYGTPPVLAPVPIPSPTNGCPSSQNFETIVLELTGTSKGTQFDRIFGVWIGGVEVLRSCTAEPISDGVVWTVKKDITRYSSLFKTNQTLAVYLGNLVNSMYTGVYHLNISLHFYPAEANTGVPTDYFDSGADLILPISRDDTILDGLWFEISNSNDVESKEFEIPQNVYRAVLEVYVSFHDDDEFWYLKNGPFREVVVRLDDQIFGAVWPSPVIYTGGFNPLLWTPITAIGSFNLPSYDIEITPLLGKILDGKIHKFGFSVTNGSNTWKVDANLHLWLDGKSAKTEGNVLDTYVSPLNLYDGTFVTNASRSINNTGWVKSSFGTIVTTATQGFQYSNVRQMETVNQSIEYNDKVYVTAPSSNPRSLESIKSFPFNLYTNEITLGFNEKKTKVSGSGVSVSTLKNMQSAQDEGTRQVYSFDDDKSCYFRNISSSNEMIVYDNINQNCR